MRDGPRKTQQRVCGIETSNARANWRVRLSALLAGPVSIGVHRCANIVILGDWIIPHLHFIGIIVAHAVEQLNDVIDSHEVEPLMAVAIGCKEDTIERAVFVERGHEYKTVYDLMAKEQNSS